jgi:diaminopropionate ammonia-lyase
VSAGALDRASFELIENPGRDQGWTTPPTGRPAARALHEQLPGYEEAPLLEVAHLAEEFGVGTVLLKDERERLGLPSFKALGASWASCWAAAQHLGAPELAADLQGLRARLGQAPGLTLTCATDGNHGRAVAHMATILGVASRILVPEGIAQARIDAIAAEGARVEVFDGTYDEAVQHAAGLADDRHVVVSDTSWPGYEEVPRRVIDGYATAFEELDRQLAGRTVDLALVPIGVGAYAAAVAAYLRGPAVSDARLVGVEPADAACLMASARVGRPVEVEGPHESSMAGLNCGIPSPVAWPILNAAFDGFCAITDEAAEWGMRRLAELGIESGECAGGTVGAALLLLAGPHADEHRSRLGIGPAATVLLPLTEGVTDPENLARVMAAGQTL